MELLSAMTDLFTATAYAEGPCAGVPCGVGGNPLPFFIFVAASVLVDVVAGLAVLFVVIGGAFLILNLGNESQADKGKKGITYALIGYAIALSSQTIISYAVAKAGTVDPNNPHLGIMETMVTSMLSIFNIVFALMMMFFGYKLLLARGQQGEMDTVKKGLGWTVTGAIAVNLAYALVRATGGLGF